jgi:phospholipase/carboxylesterase
MDTTRAIKALGAALGLALLVFWLWPGLSVTRVGPRPRAGGRVVLLLHGWGAPGKDLVSLAEELSQASPEVTFLVPEGPHRVDLSGHAWLPDFSAPTREDYIVRLAEESRKTTAQLWRVLEGARRRGVACSDILVGGFSQGGQIAARLALSTPEDCALGGVIVLSGGGSRELALPPAGGRPKMRVLVTHGRQDNVVPWSVGQETAQHFAKGGHEVRVVWFDDRHRIPPLVKAAIPQFLAGEAVGEAAE